MATERIIKKYPNRRLYDTGISRYVTIDDIRLLVRSGEKFRVVDAKTDEDITRNLLLQVILEQEDKGQPIFTIEILEQLIRTYGDAMQGFMTSYLKQSLDLFLQQQRIVQEQMDGLLKHGPVSALTEMAEQNLKLWQSLQQTAFTPFPFDTKRSNDKGPADKG
ncbi:MAG: polyhydroxyalkanoate synthesis repressor PhaR [Gammaproteobacteria bacterium]|nr:polyhydroxyalkanoate synthesis repressor PhaR [Gammaproteobacteria bacterium]